MYRSTSGKYEFNSYKPPAVNEPKNDETQFKSNPDSGLGSEIPSQEQTAMPKNGINSNDNNKNNENNAGARLDDLAKK